MGVLVYVENIVGDVLVGASGQIWKKACASVVRFVVSKLPRLFSVSQLIDGVRNIVE